MLQERSLVAPDVTRRYEYKVIDTGKRLEEELNELGAERLASRRRHDEETAVHRATPGNHLDA